MSRNRQVESPRCGTAARGFINYFNGYEEKRKATNLEPDNLNSNIILILQRKRKYSQDIKFA
ncbi:MAG: hypothetical protein JRJ65_09990 [Deltaproteobacteria bacterium]|nr:hypothetical protein [Deltaproteobacteria bacterium]